MMVGIAIANKTAMLFFLKQAAINSHPFIKKPPKINVQVLCFKAAVKKKTEETKQYPYFL